MEFTRFHRDFFSATAGSFSKVTDRENFDSQITLTDFEAAMVIEHFGLENLHVGNVQSNKLKSAKRFLLYPKFSEIFLNLVFPKPDKPELRLYISTRAGFKPKGGQIWFLYKNSFNELVIGCLEEESWAKIGQIDFDDESYQDSIENAIIKTKHSALQLEGKIQTSVVGAKTIYRRDPRLAVLRFQETNYTCEINPSHSTFVSLATNKPYMEAHHFIPMKFQHLFIEPLDAFHNIVCLCPTCHRGIHHATIDFKSDMIAKLYEKRPEIQVYKVEEIAQFYNCISSSS